MNRGVIELALQHTRQAFAASGCRVLVDANLAPVKATWAIDNRNASLRVIPGSTSGMRLETRTAGADANPYLAIAAALASGL